MYCFWCDIWCCADILLHVLPYSCRRFFCQQPPGAFSDLLSQAAPYILNNFESQPILSSFKISCNGCSLTSPDVSLCPLHCAPCHGSPHVSVNSIKYTTYCLCYMHWLSFISLTFIGILPIVHSLYFSCFCTAEVLWPFMDSLQLYSHLVRLRSAA